MGEWKLISIKGEEYFKDFYLGYGFEFFPDGKVMIKKGYNKIAQKNDDRLIIYLGSVTQFKIEDDSLRIFDLKDSIWESYKIIRMTNDTLLLSNSVNNIELFRKMKYNSDNVPSFDKIILSSSGCYGICPMMNIMIDSSGYVELLTERHNPRNGHFKSLISAAKFKELRDNFRKINYLKLKDRYSSSFTDGEYISVTFLQNNKIVKSIYDYGYDSPAELQWAYVPIRFLNQELKLDTVPQTIVPYFNLEFVTFKDKTKQLRLTKSEAFLLWKYLQHGKKVDLSEHLSYELLLVENYIEEDIEKDCFGHLYFLEKIETDGRYFKIYLKNSRPYVIDIGFNFIERNFSEPDFKTNEL